MDKKKKIIEENRKQKNEWTSEQVCEELGSLVKEIADLQITVMGQKLSLADAFTFSIRKQLKKGVVSCEIFLQTTLASAKAEAFSGKEQRIVGKQFKSSGGKKLKKDISRLWKDVVKTINEETVPSRESGAELLKKCEDYTLCTNNEWSDLWRDCILQVKLCLDAAEGGDFTAAREMVVEVNRLTKECHNLYK